MRHTIYLPDDLGQRVATHLREHPKLSLSALVQDALEHRLTPPNSGAILDLASFVPHATASARDRAEDRFISRER
jgi:hypothetical protein